MRSRGILSTAGLCLAVAFCGVPGLLCVAPAAVCAQVPEPGDPELVGWFCPNCGALVEPMSRQSCSCGYSLNGGGDGGNSTGNTGGGDTGSWGHSRPHVTTPATPTVSVEERRQREAYAREKQALLSAFQMPEAAPVIAETVSVPNALTDSVLPVHLQQASGLSAAEWARVRASQAEIDAIPRAWPLSKKDSGRLENLVTERNALWAKATSAPGLTAEERERLRLTLFTIPQPANVPVATATGASLQELRQETTDETTLSNNPVAITLARQILVDSAVSMVEQDGEEWAGDLLGDAAGARFGTVLGLAKVVIAAKEDSAEGLAALGDVLVGLIPLPQVGPTMATGRIYSNLTYQAMNDFMLQSMHAVGGTADTEAFWKELDDDLSVNLRAYRKWIGFGS